jgi:hypothetical protein
VPGTPIGHSDVVTLHVVPVDGTASRPFHPCDWVTADQAAYPGCIFDTKTSDGKVIDAYVGT